MRNDIPSIAKDHSKISRSFMKRTRTPKRYTTPPSSCILLTSTNLLRISFRTKQPVNNSSPQTTIALLLSFLFFFVDFLLILIAVDTTAANLEGFSAVWSFKIRYKEPGNFKQVPEMNPGGSIIITIAQRWQINTVTGTDVYMQILYQRKSGLQQQRFAISPQIYRQRYMQVRKNRTNCVACFSCEAPGGLGGKMVVISGCEREDF